MIVQIDTDEMYPVYFLYKDGWYTNGKVKEIDITEEMYERYLKAHAEYHAIQEVLANLVGEDYLVGED